MKPLGKTPIVLTVDDDSEVRRFIRRALERDGYHVREAASGIEALALLADGDPLDLLIADLEMPALAGEEMARQIRTARPDQRVLYCTGYPEQLFAARGVLWQYEAFIEKPFTPAGLLEAVSLILYGTIHRPTAA